MRFRNYKNSAFSLVEVTLALGVAAFCLIAVFGLIPVSMQTNRNATSQTASTSIIASVVADLQATPTANSTSRSSELHLGPTPPCILMAQGKHQRHQPQIPVIN